VRQRPPVPELSSARRQVGPGGRVIPRRLFGALRSSVIADAGSFDLIVVGSRGKSAAARFLMGSVSERVVRHASRPVLVVR
jgi:nucleotide-binding universal stress UspA family protein